MRALRLDDEGLKRGSLAFEGEGGEGFFAQLDRVADLETGLRPDDPTNGHGVSYAIDEGRFPDGVQMIGTRRARQKQHNT